jgi:hypothetical protein
MKREITFYRLLFLLALPVLSFFSSCKDEDSGIADYAGSPEVSNIRIEENSFSPKITWVGGYVSVIGVNRGSHAALDTSLVWLIRTDGNNIHYPVRFGTLPSGAADITSQFGGAGLDSLNEDEVYTFWVLKEDVWNQVSSYPDSRLIADSTLSSSVVAAGDSIRINTYSYNSIVQALDVYVNISGLTQFGRLGLVTVTATNSNKPIISWAITEAGASDSNLSAIGIVEGQQYVADYAVWDVYSESDSSGTLLYGRQNVIAGPLQAGTELPGTRTFVELPETGLERGKTYYIWIARDNWNRTSRTRTTSGYAYAVFNVE